MLVTMAKRASSEGQEESKHMLKDFTPRLYQEHIFHTCTKQNTLVVLPTGVGKTAIFLLMAAYRLQMYPKSKVILLGPTRPLIEQYSSVFEEHFNIAKEEMVIFTGFVSPEKRAALWKNARVIFSTPQGLENDILSSKIDLSEVSLIGFDESHRATGEYSYNFIAKQYMKKALHPRILALTASPGSDQETIQEVCKNLFIESIEIRTIEDEDVAPYVQEVDIKKVFVELPDEFLAIKKHLSECYQSKLRELKNYGFRIDTTASKRELLGIQAGIHGQLARGEQDFEMMKAISLIAEAIKVHHAIELIETQGIHSLQEYFNKLQHEASTGKTKATKNLVNDINFRNAYARTLHASTVIHPKLAELKSIVTAELDPAIPENKSKKIIIFSQYRDAGKQITEELAALDIKTKLFVGQAKKKDTGLSQKKQKEMLDNFSAGAFNILVSSSVGEEGLDIPQVDLVIFYEPVPSAIRKIQRSGRTGRLEKGRIIMLITKDTIDEIYYHVARNKEKRMYRAIDTIKRIFPNGQMTASQKNTPQAAPTVNTLLEYEKQSQKSENPDANPAIATAVSITADYREKGSGVLKEIVQQDITLHLEKLAIGDFILSPRVIVEYKTVPDFVDSIIDGRLLSQLKELTTYARPMIIIEGQEDLYAARKIHPNAIRGMLATIMVSYGIPLLQTKNPKDTAELLIAIAKREQLDQTREVVYHHAKPLSLKEQQEYFISALPNIGTGGARPLLKHFGSVKNIVNASTEELQDVALIGPKKAKAMKEVFEKEWEE